MHIRTNVRILIAICTLPFLLLSLIGTLEIYYEGIEGFNVSIVFAFVATIIGGYLSLIGRIPIQATKCD